MDVPRQYILALGYLNVDGKIMFDSYSCVSVNMDSNKEIISCFDTLRQLKTIPAPDKKYNAIYLIPYPCEAAKDIIKLK